MGQNNPGTSSTKKPRDGSKAGRKLGASGLSKPGLSKPGLTKPNQPKPGISYPGMKKSENKPKILFKKAEITKPKEKDLNEETDELAAKIEAVEQSEEALEAKAEALQEEYKAETPEASKPQEINESSSNQPDENIESPIKKQFKRPEGEKSAEPRVESLTGSNLRMVQKAQLEIKKKDTEISRLNDEIKELCKYYS